MLEQEERRLEQLEQEAGRREGSAHSALSEADCDDEEIDDDEPLDADDDDDGEAFTLASATLHPLSPQLLAANPELAAVVRFFVPCAPLPASHLAYRWLKRLRSQPPAAPCSRHPRVSRPP